MQDLTMITTRNPANDGVLESYSVFNPSEISEAITHTHEAYLKWRRTPVQLRCDLLLSVAEQLRTQRETLAKLICMEMGKPLVQALAEVEKCEWVCQFYAENATAFLQDEKIASDFKDSFVTFEPLGVVLAVMPWNFPFWQVFRFAAPNLTAGNACLLKHATNVTGCALAIEKVFRDAGCPQALFTSLIIDSTQVEDVIKHEHVSAVSLTGSVEAGRAVAQAAGKVIKKTVLELGGSDPYLILADANIAKAAEMCAKSRLINSGQSCISAKRFIVVNEIKDEFEKHLVSHMAQAQLGDPMDKNTQIGPLAREDLRRTLHQQVQKSIACGAKLLLGGDIPDGAGTFYPATVLTDVPTSSPAYHEELFGPVAAIIPVADEEAAILVANDSIFGLGAAVFTEDSALAMTIARRLETGTCAINDFVKSDPRLPFGGIKQSGYGRELSHYGLKEFMNSKTIVVGS